ncbi:hypothetical protein CDL15_Pgr022020 [Punica granatum]|uniref:Uncharacterized protein n=1 Tax=Punica granatum TaxID=22663 RepID=A0A218VRZ5_PUNGR|nr:hypothetical protein CDL15_Pgr022020 [Punica granatum]
MIVLDPDGSIVKVLIGVPAVGLLGLVGFSGFPTEDLVARLPDQPEVGFRQFAGYVDVDLRHGRSLFYYFVEADKDPDKKPLTLWLNGGGLSMNDFIVAAKIDLIKTSDLVPKKRIWA